MREYKEIGVTANKETQHHLFYVQLARALKINWRDVGPHLAYWDVMYTADPGLNNHPIEAFDRHYPTHVSRAQELGISWSLSDTVCCLKAAIREELKINVS